MKLILASGSERRQELLGRIASNFLVMVSEFDEESILYAGDCEAYVKELALGKVKSVMSRIDEVAVIIGCDTIVFFNGKVLGKPKDKLDAINMLKKLSDNVHIVYSGIALLNTATNQILTDCVKTEVKFSSLNEEDIIKYVNSSEPMDKAGAYGIQGYGGLFVEEIHGCYYNVVGLPMNKLKKMLIEMAVNL
jgi:septum formation protein